jgi:hypothetical protein
LSTIHVNEQELSGEMLKWYRQMKTDTTLGPDTSVQTQMDL